MRGAYPRLVIIIAAAVLAGACGGSDAAREPPPFDRAPIVLISIDTLRSDRLPAYGYAGVETPAIDALRRDAVLAERAYSPYPLTLPAHVSILTGLLPPEHGVRENLGYRLDAARMPYLPARLRAAGYRTGAFVSALVLSADTGLATGFEVYDDAATTAAASADPGFVGVGQRRGMETVVRAIEWLDSIDVAEPFFLFVHLYEPHTPYQAPEPFASSYSDPYDAEIAAVDAVVGRLVGALRARGAYDSAIVALVSDHGEGLGDHGEAEHGILLHREALQVPLLVKLPGNARAGTSLPSPVQLSDLAPTLRALVGVPGRRDSAGEARTIFHLGTQDAPDRSLYAETFYPRLQLGWSELGSIINGDWHYIEGPEPALYDLVSDPGETANLLTQERRLGHRLAAMWSEMTTSLAAPREVDEEAVRNLAALGYLASPSLPGDGPLEDPHHALPALATLREAEHRAAAGEVEGALEIVERVLGEHPRMCIGWIAEAEMLESIGRIEEAYEAYREAVRINPNHPRASLGGAKLAMLLGRLYEAGGLARQARSAHPWHAESMLADIMLASGNLDAAAEHADRALASRPFAAAPRLTLLMIALRRSDVVAARRQLDQVLAAELPSAPGLSFAAAEVLAAEGRFEEAEERYRLAIHNAPRLDAAYVRLANLHVVRGRFGDAIVVLNELVTTNPYPWAYASAIRALESLGNPTQAEALRRVARQRFGDLPAFAKVTPPTLDVAVEPPEEG